MPALLCLEGLLIPCYPQFPLALTFFLPSLPQSSRNSKERDLMVASGIGLSVPKEGLSFFANCLAVGLCFCSHLLQERRKFL